ncbi:MAG: hypothetical protein E6Q88_08250 [Lysobacteraceae bacterium]|nr:MAG: hypothetical protein E6Q88_08250 [Xanthomonadaceae bacterium]
MSSTLTLAMLVALAAAFSAPIGAMEAQSQAEGEYSLTPRASAQAWRATGLSMTHMTRIRYEDIPVARLLDLQRKNASSGPKATQIGIGRRAALESARPMLPALKWSPTSGGMVARIEIASPDALALRVGLHVLRLDDRVELRFGGSDDRSHVVAMMQGAQIKRLPGPEGLFWTPNTDGEAQIIEIFRPFGVPASAVRLEAPMVSHLLVDSRSSFKLLEKIGESGACNVDTISRIAELGPAFPAVKNAVAHMRFTGSGGGTFICTGTLLNDTVPVTQIPYFHGANHCFSNNTSVPPVASQMQSVANTLNTFWNYETTGCSNLTSTPVVQLSGGATYLFSNHSTDGMLLRLNNPAPAGAFFAGWNAAPMTSGVAITAIHHPRGDSKKVSTGQTVSIDGSNIEAAWLSGTTEGGSSGSGLFTISRHGQYVLRGGLFGGTASCANSGTIGNTQNRDYYSRLDVDFPILKTYLEPQAEAENGSAPLVRARSAATVVAPRAASEGRRERRAGHGPGHRLDNRLDDTPSAQVRK